MFPCLLNRVEKLIYKGAYRPLFVNLTEKKLAKGYEITGIHVRNPRVTYTALAHAKMCYTVHAFNILKSNQFAYIIISKKKLDSRSLP